MWAEVVRVGADAAHSEHCFYLYFYPLNIQQFKVWTGSAAANLQHSRQIPGRSEMIVIFIFHFAVVSLSSSLQQMCCSHVFCENTKLWVFHVAAADGAWVKSKWKSKHRLAAVLATTRSCLTASTCRLDLSRSSELQVAAPQRLQGHSGLRKKTLCSWFKIKCSLSHSRKKVCSNLYTVDLDSVKGNQLGNEVVRGHITMTLPFLEGEIR